MQIKCLSVNPPWARKIIFEDKDIENRPWKTKHRGLIAIHETKNGGGSGCIIGLANLVDCVDSSDSPYFFGPYGFVLTDKKSIEPIPIKGKLGLFNINIPDSVLEQIE